MSYKTENQIFTDIKAVLDAFLATLTSQSGWKVLRGNQPVPVGINNKMILISKVYATRYGWQGSTDKDIADNYKHVEMWWEELRWQLSFFCQRDPKNDTTATWTAEDMAKRVMAYLDGMAGLQALLKKGYRKLRNAMITPGSFVNDSELYEFNPSFDIVLLHQQTVESAAQWATIGDMQAVGI